LRKRRLEIRLSTTTSTASRIQTHSRSGRQACGHLRQVTGPHRAPASDCCSGRGQPFAQNGSFWTRDGHDGLITAELQSRSGITPQDCHFHFCKARCGSLKKSCKGKSPVTSPCKPHHPPTPQPRPRPTWKPFRRRMFQTQACMTCQIAPDGQHVQQEVDAPPAESSVPAFWWRDRTSGQHPRRLVCCSRPREHAGRSQRRAQAPTFLRAWAICKYPPTPAGHEHNSTPAQRKKLPAPATACRIRNVGDVQT